MLLSETIIKNNKNNITENNEIFNKNIIFLFSKICSQICAYTYTLKTLILIYIKLNNN